MDQRNLLHLKKSVIIAAEWLLSAVIEHKENPLCSFLVAVTRMNVADITP